MNNSEDWSHIFTPLALEQPLPELPLARLRFDLQTAKRAEENLIKSANETSSTRYLLVDNDHIAVPQHSALKARLSYELIRAIELPADYIHLLEEKVSHDVLFLGNYEGITYCVLWIHDNSNIMVALHHRYDWISCRCCEPGSMAYASSFLSSLQCKNRNDCWGVGAVLPTV